MFREIEYTGKIRPTKNEATFKKLGTGYVLVLPKHIKKNLPDTFSIFFDDETGSIAIGMNGGFSINASGKISCRELKRFVKDGAKFSIKESTKFLVLLEPA